VEAAEAAVELLKKQVRNMHSYAQCTACS
jgi:hypothetical protein